MNLAQRLIYLPLLFPSIALAGTAYYDGIPVDLCDPRVFNADYYVSKYPELASHPGGPCSHFSNYGISENRQAHEVFWAYQYISINDDLKKSFGQNYMRGITHYLAVGHNEGRIVSILLDPSTKSETPVYNEAYYRQKYPDLRSLDSFYLARHFLMHGLGEGRQGSRLIAINDYLTLNSDLKAIYSSNAPAAMAHYLRYGMKENRSTIIDNIYAIDPANNLGQLSNGTISIGFSKWVAGAITSLKYNGKEFVNNHDHGRQISYAWSYNNKGECDNPTENGSKQNDIGSTTTSELLDFSFSTNVFSSRNRPAFWLQAHDSNGECGGYTNTNDTNTSDDVLEKTVTIGTFGPNTFTMQSAITISRDADVIQIESPSIYLNEDFNQFYYIDYLDPNRQIRPFAHTVRSIDWRGYASGPIIFSTSDRTNAIAVIQEGVYSIKGGLPFYFAMDRYNDNRANSTTKIASVINYFEVKRGDRRFTKSHIIVGSFASVSAKAKEVVEQLANAKLNLPRKMAERFDSYNYQRANSLPSTYDTPDKLFRHCLQHGLHDQRPYCYELRGL